MALDAETAAGGLIRKVQKALGKGSQAALLAPLLYARDGLSGLEGLPADWLAGNAREAMEFIADKPRGRHKIRVRRMPASGKGAVPEGSVRRDPQRRHAVPRRFGAGRAAGPRPCGAPPVPPDLQDPARQGRAACRPSPVPATRNWGDGHQESYIAIHLRALPEAEARDLTAAISDILAEVRVVVADWRAMLQRLEAARKQLEVAHANLPGEVLGEAIAFLQWLEQANFTFLGARYFELTGDPALPSDLASVDGSGLGVLRDPEVQVLRRGSELVAMTPEVRRFFFEPSPLIITKANVVSRVHRRAHMDYIGIKTYHGRRQAEG